MASYVIRRLLLLVPVLWGVTALVFLLIHLAPGDPIVNIVGFHPSVEDVARVRAQLGLDRPLPVQYLLWLERVLHGDLGTSLLAHEPVTKLIIERLPTTVTLTATSMAFGALVGVPLGVISATKQGGIVDNVVRIASIVGISMPAFWLGILLIILFALIYPLFPPGGSTAEYGPVALVLPTVALGTPFAAAIGRFTRAEMLEVLQQDYVRTARAKGLAPWAVDYRHALRNGLLPILTVFGLNTGHLLSGAVLTETVFSLPGLGRLMVDSVGARDYPLVLGSALAIAFMFVLVNLVVDLLYAVLDPRVRY